MFFRIRGRDEGKKIEYLFLFFLRGIWGHPLGLFFSSIERTLPNLTFATFLLCACNIIN